MFNSMFSLLIGCFSCLESTVHIYNRKVEAEGKPVTNQKSSGRCWLFAALNVARQPFIKQYNLEDFEFSQGHLFYWDKIERANYFLHNIGWYCMLQGGIKFSSSKYPSSLFMDNSLK